MPTIPVATTAIGSFSESRTGASDFGAMIALAPPQLQVDFALALEQMRSMYLQEALSETVIRLDVRRLDRELAQFVPADSLRKLAGHGLRGELMFAVPTILRTSPRVLGYYRLLLGYS